MVNLVELTKVEEVVDLTIQDLVRQVKVDLE
jgi:hypothetical protein